MFNGFKKKAKKALDAVQDAVKTTYKVTNDKGVVVAEGLSEEDLRAYIEASFNIKIEKVD